MQDAFAADYLSTTPRQETVFNSDRKMWTNRESKGRRHFLFVEYKGICSLGYDVLMSDWLQRRQ